MLCPRPHYLDQVLAFRNQKIVKVITGIRRCGKSSLLELVQAELKKTATNEAVFITLHLDYMSSPISSARELYNYVKERLSATFTTYVFLDEIQTVKDWHKAINSLREEFDCDIYLTGSNAFLLSSDLATYLSGRCVEIPLLPLSFEEYCEFCDLTLQGDSSVFTGADGFFTTFDDVFSRYLTFGGMPQIANLTTTQDMQEHYLASVYNTVVEKDILARDERQKRQLRSPALLRRLCEFLANTQGNVLSTTKLAARLAANAQPINHSTIQAYLDAIQAAYVVYRCQRYDVKGRHVLTRLPKYYMVDTGLANYLDGYRLENSGFRFENAVYLQLKYLSQNVHVGKVGEREVDFIALAGNTMRYLQVCENFGEAAVQDRELRALRLLNNSHEKLVITRYGVPPQGSVTEDGIKIVSARQFFLGARELGF